MNENRNFSSSSEPNTMPSAAQNVADGIAVAENPNEPQNNAPKKKKSSGKWWKIPLVVVALLLVAVFAFAAWLLSTESGLRFAVYKLPALAGVNIQSASLKGTFLNGFDGQEWQIQTSAADVNIDSLEWKWQPRELLDGRLHINRIAAGDIHILSKPTPPKESTPRSLPQSVSLPLEVLVDEIAIGKITTGEAKTVLLNGASARYSYNHQQHHFTLNNLQTPWSNNQGEVRLQTASPFALQGKITGDGVLSDVEVKGDIHLGGNLEKVLLNADLAGGNIALRADTAVSPFENSLDKIIGRVLLHGQNINPADFVPSAPRALLNFDANVEPVFANGKVSADGIALTGKIDLNNAAAAPSDAKGIPVRSVNGDFTINQQGVLNLADTTVKLLKQGEVVLNGSTDTAKKTLNLNAKVQRFALNDVVQQTFDDQINGDLQLKGSYSAPQLQWNLNSRRANSTGEAKLLSDTKNGQRTLDLVAMRLAPQNGGELLAKGRLELFQKQVLKLDVNSKNFNPNRLYPSFPAGNVNGEIKLDGRLAEQVFGGKMKFGQSTLSGVNLQGEADVLYEQKHLAKAVSHILLGRNQLKTSGSFGKAGDRLNLDINAPDLDKFGFGISGLLIAKGYIAGEPKKLEANVAGTVRALRVGQNVQIGSLDFKAIGSPDYSRPLDLQVKGENVVLAANKLNVVDLSVKGTGLQHRIAGSGNLALSGKPYQLRVAADGSLNPNNQQWKGVVSALDVSGAFNLHLQNRMNLEAGAERVVMSAARWSAMRGSLNLNSLVWDKKTGLITKGSADGLHIEELHNFFKLPVQHNLVLAGDWDIAYSQNARGYLNVRQQSGDIILPQRNQALGLQGVVLNTRLSDGRIDNQISGKTRYGDLKGNVAISQRFGNQITLAPIQGNISLNVPDLNAVRNLLPVGHAVKGSLIAQANISGTVGKPALNGTLNGDNLYYVNRDVGLILDNGSLRSRLSGQKWLIDSLQFTRGGTVKLNGEVSLDTGDPDVNVNVLFDKYRALDKPNRRLTVSGDTKLLYLPSRGVTLNGTLSVDEGRFGFQKFGMPTLDDDVVIVGEAPKEKKEAVAINMNLILDLNDKFRFVGEGLDVTLGGRLNLLAKAGEEVRGVGTIHVVKGKYKAYAQDLNITKGTISFVGPLSDPALNIRAVRNLSPVGAGVEVLGSLNNPRVNLVADEAMSEKDKLSWLILNRASSGSDGDEAALSAAAGAWLAGTINDKIGLVDDFGFTSKRSRNAQTGELNPAEQVLTVGKQLTNNLHIGYEYGINTASQSVKLVYQLTKSIQAIARVGSESSGGEVKYVVRFD
ncbi:MAG: translocation/assembly module TamB domain-containing protein [Neisseria sp.]|nr:translocation/assembly module TamB domain-containing protein [Neisseria sp.]